MPAVLTVKNRKTPQHTRRGSGPEAPCPYRPGRHHTIPYPLCAPAPACLFPGNGSKIQVDRPLQRQSLVGPGIGPAPLHFRCLMTRTRTRPRGTSSQCLGQATASSFRTCRTVCPGGPMLCLLRAPPPPQGMVGGGRVPPAASPPPPQGMVVGGGVPPAASPPPSGNGRRRRGPPRCAPPPPGNGRRRRGPPPKTKKTAADCDCLTNVARHDVLFSVSDTVCVLRCNQVWHRE